MHLIFDPDYYEEDESGGEESVQLLCCSFQKYLHCSESVVNDTCGYDTAKFTKSFLDRMSGPLIQVTLDFQATKKGEIEGIGVAA